MTKKTKVVVTAVLIGMIIAFCLAVSVASIYWFSSNPSLDELRTATVDRMTLTEAEAKRLSQQMMAGAIIDFMINLALYVCPSIVIGGILGFVTGMIRQKRDHHNEGSIDVAEL